MQKNNFRLRPILFSTQMVQYILDGRKTQTRRIIKSRHKSGLFRFEKRNVDDTITGITSLDWDERPMSDSTNDIKPKYQIGDILWVRETHKVGAWNDEEQKIAFDYKASPELKKTPWVEYENLDAFEKIHLKIIEELNRLGIEPSKIDEENERFYYKWEPGKSPLKWKPSIFMPFEAARIFLKVTNVRVERLHNISEQDAISEGIDISLSFRGMPGTFYLNYLENKFNFSSPGLSFSSLWISINGKDSWKENPFVWVYDFERCELPKDLLQ